jgi:hypothetical protein
MGLLLCPHHLVPSRDALNLFCRRRARKGQPDEEEILEHDVYHFRIWQHLGPSIEPIKQRF